MSWRIRLDIEYDGSEFAGWQVQPGLSTVQGALERALATLCGRNVRVTGAGRTDAGVHALGQVAHATIPNRRYTCERLLEGLNALTPDAVVIHGISEVEPDFDARRSACWRYYRYRIVNRRTAYLRHVVWAVPHALHLKYLRACARALPGTHSFASFCVARSAARGTRCTVTDAHWRRRQGELEFHIRGDRFVHGMVRSLVGTMVKVGTGRMAPDTFVALLQTPSRQDAGPPAPACGLCLMSVGYNTMDESDGSWMV